MSDAEIHAKNLEDRDLNEAQALELLNLLKRINSAVRALGVAIAILFVMLAGVGVIVQARNDSIDTLERSSAEVEAASHKAENAAEQASRDLADALAAAAAGGERTARAVDEIFDIKRVLCEMFPDAQACQERIDGYQPTATTRRT